MSDLDSFLAHVSVDETDRTHRLVFCDWVEEHGGEPEWTAYLDEFPDHHEVRQRFGAWLIQRDDPRGRGMVVLARCKRRVYHHNWKPGGTGTDVKKVSCWTWWRSRRNNDGNLGMFNRLPIAWFKKITCAFECQTDDGLAIAKDFLARSEAESAAAIAWSELTPAEQAEVFGLFKITYD